MIGGRGPTGTMPVGLIYETVSIFSSVASKHNTYVSLRAVVARLDMIETRRILECWEGPVELPQPPIKLPDIIINRRRKIETYEWMLGYPARIVRILHLNCPT
jgi:hypothetical protein